MIKKNVFLALGVFSFLLGVLGVILPLLPATPFMLLSSWFFMNSSKRAHTWLLRQPYVGNLIADWQTKKGISKQNKLISIFLIWSSSVFCFISLQTVILKLVLLFILASSSIFILTRKS